MTSSNLVVWLVTAWVCRSKDSLPIKAEARHHDELQSDVGMKLLMSAKLPTKCGQEPFSFWIKIKELEGMCMRTLTFCARNIKHSSELCVHWKDVLCVNDESEQTSEAPSPPDDATPPHPVQMHAALESNQQDPEKLAEMNAHKFISTMVPTDCEEDPKVSLNLWATLQDLKGIAC